jgi:AcrR family transcriptional regulator
MWPDSNKKQSFVFYMPKLAERAVERNQEKIEAAALRLFIQRGFYGTSVRDIADEAGVSLGNIYNYYPTKEALFASLVRRYEKRVARLTREVLKPLGGSLDPAALRRLARGVRKIVYREPDYWRLMYLDVIEFGNRHFAHSFRDLSRNLQAIIGEPVCLSGNGSKRVDAGLAFTAIYLQFFTYFLLEKLFGGKQHLGFPEQQAIGQLIEIFSHGVHPARKNGTRSQRALKVRR